MKKLSLLILSIFVFTGVSSQTISISDISRNWQLKDGWFPERNLEFVTTDKNKSNYAFRFEENGEIKYLELENSRQPPDS